MISLLKKIIEKGLYIDAKSTLQELSQDKLGLTPTYEVISEAGPDHAKEFVIGVYIGDDLIGKGKGSSKQSAQQEAAKKGLQNWSQ